MNKNIKTYGTHSGCGPVVFIDLRVKGARALWDALDRITCMTQEDRIIQALFDLGALVTEEEEKRLFGGMRGDDQ